MSYKYLKSGVDSGNILVTNQILRTTDYAIIPFDEIVNTTRASFAAIDSLKEGKWILVN